MQMLYNSASFAVVQFDDLEAGDDKHTPAKGGYEIVDKFARKEIYLQGALADSFKRGVQALVDAGPTEEALDEFIAGYTLMALQPLVLH
jgi:hypothetical protein